MKKIFIVASVLLMCCMFMGCGVKAKLDGTWKSNNVYTEDEYAEFEFEYKDVPTTSSLPAKQTSTTNMTLTINKDGTFTQEVMYSEKYTVDVEEIEENNGEEALDNITNIKSLDDYSHSSKYSGTWYYHDSDKVILKTTNSSEQYNDEDPEEDNNVNYRSAELVLVDDILFVDFGGGIYEFTKAE